MVFWGGGSCVGQTGAFTISGNTIDNICAKEHEVTFIKMDIEGAERKALEGAKHTIMRHIPRLAISIYHKPLDILEIPAYILSLMPEYKFAIRHYSADMTETVLYAEV